MEIAINSVLFQIQPVSNVVVSMKEPRASKMSHLKEYKESAAKYGFDIVKMRVMGIATLPSEYYDHVAINLLDDMPGLSQYANIFNPDYTEQQMEQVYRGGTEADFVEFRKKMQTGCIVFVNQETKEYFAADSSGYDYARYVCFPMETQFVYNPSVEEIEAETEPIVNEDHLMSNEKCYIQIHEDGSMYGGDKTDRNNDPRFYTKNKRGHKKAVAEMREVFNKDTKMYDLVQIAAKYKLNPRTYYGMD